MFGFGIETHALEDAVGLNSARGRRRIGSGIFGCVAIFIMVVVKRNQNSILVLLRGDNKMYFGYSDTVEIAD